MDLIERIEARKSELFEILSNLIKIDEETLYSKCKTLKSIMHVEDCFDIIEKYKGQDE